MEVLQERRLLRGVHLPELVRGLRRVAAREQHVAQMNTGFTVRWISCESAAEILFSVAQRRGLPTRRRA